MKKLLAVLLVGASPFAYALEGKRNRVALVVALEKSKISMTSIELYQHAEKAIASFQDWDLIPSNEFQPQLPKSFANLGSISVIPNEDLNHSLKGIGLFKKKSISGLQAALDSMVADAAVIARCEEASDKRAKQCKLFYYDRTEQKVVAVAGKKFTTPVSTVSAWGISLATNLKHGLQEKKVESDKERIRRLLQDKEETPKRKTLVGLGAYNQTINDPGRTFKSIPGVYGLIGVQGETYGSGILAGVARTATSDSGAQAKLMERFAGLQLSARTKALDSIYWELAFGLIYNIRTISRFDFETEEESVQNDKSLKFQFKPGLFWAVHENAQIGMMVSYTKDTATASQRSGYFKSLAIDTSGFGLELGTRIQF